METSLNNLIEQKHLLNEIDLYIYSSFLEGDGVNELIELFKTKEVDLENMLNKLQINSKAKSKKHFIEYIKFREKIRDKEKELFTKVFEIVAD